jgi:restriction system protein
MEIIDATKMSLEEWLNLLFNPPKDVLFTGVEFPTNQHYQEYLETIDQRSDKEIFQLLEKFLIPSTTLPVDKFRLEQFKASQKNNQENIYAKMLAFYTQIRPCRYFQRLLLNALGISQIPPWEGITWVLDLFPHFPKQALEGLNAYILAHAQVLPDGFYRGLHEACGIIRAKFIGLPGTTSKLIQFLLDLNPRYFEHLIERLYNEMGYKTSLTPAQKDGGRDVIAIQNNPGKREKLFIECERYNKPVGVVIVRALLGVVSDEKVNKGVIVTTDRFTKPARKFAEQNHRIELINGAQLVILMNEHLGSTWPLHIERLVSDSQILSKTQ